SKGWKCHQLLLRWWSVMAGSSFQGQLQSLIIGGRDASPHSRPYMVSIQKGGSHICGGSLIKERWVLTAAHCLPCQGEEALKVVVGLHQLKKYDPKQVFSVMDPIPHPSYCHKTMEGDIIPDLAFRSCLQLDRKVAPNKITKFIQLSKEQDLGIQCSVAGWGLSKEGGKLSPVLRELDVKVMDARMCNNSRFWNGGITESMICIEGVEKGSTPWTGDSGGPVVCGKKAKVAGIISFTDGKVDVFKPPVATAVFKYKEWIQKTIARADL
uniref:Granzyme M n=1 Tax=Pelusios castaneus TaxID=367368 RepID=A0A8C8SLF5_9SAUR